MKSWDILPEKIRVFYLIVNEQKDPDRAVTSRICRYLEDRGKTCYVRADAASEKNAESTWHYTNAVDIPGDVQAVLVLGGDGTLLQAARDLVDCHLPLLGINLGTLGFLAEIELQHVYEALDLLMEGRYTIEKRMMLRGQVFRQGERIMEDIALNDAVLVRRSRLRVMNFQIYVDKAFLCSYRADGMILSTPTGSTGYSLSAGGPIVAPDASLLVMTAIAPHTLSSRPVILPDTVEVGIEVSGSAQDAGQGLAEIIFDGDTAKELLIGDEVRISRSDRQVALIKIRNTSFIEVLRNKMN